MWKGPGTSAPLFQTATWKAPVQGSGGLHPVRALPINNTNCPQHTSLLLSASCGIFIAARRSSAWHRRKAAAAVRAQPWAITPLPSCGFGGTVTGFDLRELLASPALVSQLRADLAKHSFIVFSGQQHLTGEDHVALSEVLGSLDHGLHKAHPRAPDPRLLRVSNDAEEGFVLIGTSGWHVDGVMLKAPFAVQTMHFLHAIEGGDTLFLSFKGFLESLEEEAVERLRRLWFVSGVGKNLAAGEGQLSLLPLVYKHPFTGEETMCFHLGEKYCLGWIEEQPQPEGFEAVIGGLLGVSAAPSRLDVLRGLLPGKKEVMGFSALPPRPTQQWLDSLIGRLSGDARKRAIWQQSWSDGDFAVIDNMALAHLPVPSTQASRDRSGLRLFHRTTMTDEKAVVKNARGAESLLLVGQGGELTGSRAGAVRDAGAMRAILTALMKASAEQAAPEESAAAAPKRVQTAKEKGARSALAQKLRKKALAKRKAA